MVRLFGKNKEENKVDEAKSGTTSSVQEVAEKPKESEKVETPTQQVVIEREINLSLLNEKLNVLLSMNQEILSILKGEE